eukprot:gene11906-13140_t
MSGFSPVFVNSLTYIGTAAIFTAVFFIDMPDLPYPIQGNLVKQPKNGANSNLRYLIFALWNFHFIRRFIEVLFVHIYKRKMPAVESIGAPIYYWTFALFIAWSIDTKYTYKVSNLDLIIPGVILFIVGDIGNCWCHVQLRIFRTGNREEKSHLISPKTGHIVPYGCMFNLVSCPHYFFEITSWFGFFLISMTLPSLLLLLCTIITLLIYSRKKHIAYLAEFDGKDERPLYPEHRKALVPFVF